MTEKFIPIDQATRDLAIEDHATIFNVEAGAGTGKTSLLTSRYVRLIETGMARPTEIVAITFTEKAAFELRDRIRRELEQRNMSDALDELDRAPISTIHSFAASLLRERPFEAKLDPNFEQLDAIGAELFLRGCYERWLQLTLSSEPGGSPSPLSRALASGIRLESIREIAFALHAHRDLLHATPTCPTKLAIEKMFNEVALEAEALWALASSSCVDTTDEGYKAIENLWREVETVRHAPEDIKERALLLRMEAPAKGNQAKWARADVAKEQKTRMKELGEKLKVFQQSLREHIFSDLLGWLRGFVEFAESEKWTHSKLDFDDLLFTARDLLKNNLEVRHYFQGRYRYFLIDEFQDTDPIQVEMIWYLASKTNAPKSSSAIQWNDLTLTPGKLFLVGDPKQSIYRFRRASIETYEAATSSAIAQGKRLVIQQNFRSSGPLIAWVNKMFEQVLESSYEPLSADVRHQFREEHKPVVVLKSPEQLEGKNVGEIRRLEAEAIAAYLTQLLQAKTRKIHDKETEELRDVRPGDIAILFPSMTDIDLFEELLRKYDLPFSLEGGHLFYHRAEIHGVLAALDAIAHPTEPIAVVAALRSILFGLSDQDLFEIMSSGQSFDYRTANVEKLREPIRTAYRILADLHAAQADLQPSELILKLLDRCTAFPLTLSRFHGEQATANLEKLVSLALHHEQSGMFSIDQFVRWARERTEESEQQSESSLTESDDQRIRLLTVHKAKGLEFPVVVLANLSTGRDQPERVLADRFKEILALGIGPKDMRFCTSNYEELLEIEKLRKADERKRLLYVATTRARDLLVITHFQGERAPPTSLWKMWEAGFEFESSLVESMPFSSLKMKDDPAIQPVVSTPQKPSMVLGVLKKREEEIQEQVKKRREIFVPGLPIKTATELVVADEAAQLKLERTRIATHSSALGGREFGSALHAVLERIDIQKPESLPNICKIVAIEAGIPEAREELERLSKLALASPLFARIRAAKSVSREVPFSWMESGTLYEGVIDLVFEEPEGLVIVDYKTDNVREEQLAARTAHYAPQIQIYANALKKITQRPVKEQLVFFVRLSTAMESKGS